MYSDYPTIYESRVNYGYYAIFGIIALILLIITIISIARIYKKANHSVISAFIPIYNVIVLLEIVNLPKWYIFLLLIPIFNLVILYKISMELAHSFKRSEIFGFGLLLLPFIYYPILAFSENDYLGINLIAKEGTTTVTDIPIIDEKEDKDLTIHEEQDIASRNINISIGGGVYQKDYTKELLQADDKQLIKKEPVDLINNKPEVKDTSNNTFIKNPFEDKKEETLKTSEVSAFEMPSMIQTSKVAEKELTPANNDNKVRENQSESNDDYMLCPNCGTKLTKGVGMCFICGTQIQ